MGLRRRSLEAGHRRKFLVVVDDTVECDRAVVFAARRAEHTGGGLVLLAVIDDADFRGFLGVEQVMRAEATAEAEATLDAVAERIRALAPAVRPERVVREGAAATCVVRHIEEDEDIAVLVLAAGTGADGPGPLVTAIGRASGSFPVPVTIVPGHLSDDDIAAIA